MREIHKVNELEFKFFNLGEQAKSNYQMLGSVDYAADPSVIKDLLRLMAKIDDSEKLAANGAKIHPANDYESLKAELDELTSRIGKV